MAPWRILSAGRASQAALGFHVHHGPRVSVHYSTAPAVSDSSRSFCLSRDKLTMQQLNRRLALYLQQVHCLEATNQNLERQIQEELDRKCPRELLDLDGHMRTVSLLQDQISESLSAQAQVKLQLLSAELTVFDFNIRCEKERKHRGRVEAELSDLRLLEEELKVHQLPELQSLLDDQTRQLKELQIQHQQDTQGLLAQVSGGVSVEMGRAASSDLMQQLDDLRHTSVTLLDKNQNQCWSNTQVLASAEVTFDLPEMVQAERVELRRTAAGLEAELTRLQNLNILLEDSRLEQTESFVLQLVALQHRADSLCKDLDSVLQAAAQQAADHQALMDIKNKLETEIQEYMRLLDGLSQEGPHLNSKFTIRSFCASASTTASRKVTPDKGVSVEGGNLQMIEVKTVVNPLSVTVATKESIRGCRTNQIQLSSENLRAGALTERIGKESIHVGQISQGLDGGDVIKNSKMEINPETSVITVSVPDTQSKPVTFTSEQNTKEAVSQANKTGTHIQTEITKIIPGAETEKKQGPHFVTKTTTSDPNKQTAEELKKATETTILAPMDHTEVYIQAKKPDPAQVSSLKSDPPLETVRDRDEVALTPFEVSGSHCRGSEEALDEVSDVMDDKDVERQEVQDDADTGTTTETASSGSTVSNNKLESKTASIETTELEMNEGKVVNSSHDTNQVNMAPTESVNPAGEALLTTTESKRSTSLTDSGVALSSSDTEEHLSPRITDVFLSPVEAEVLMSMTDKVFCPVDPEDHIKSPDLLLIANDPEMYLSPNDSDTCLSPAETKGCLSPNGLEEDEEACLSITEANAHVRPVEKYILSTKEEGQTLLFSGEQVLPERRNEKISTSAKDEESVGSFKDNERSRAAVTGTKPTSQRSNRQLSSSLGSLEFRDLGGRSIIADKEEQLGFGGLYRKSVKDARSPGDRHKNTTSTARNKDAQSPGRDPGGQKETASSSDVASGTAANSSATVSSNVEPAAPAELQGRFRRGSGEWMVYGSSLGHTRMSVPSTGSEESPPVATEPVTSRPETGRFSSRGSGEWMVYGGSLRRKSSLDAGTKLPSEENRESPSVNTDPVTETGRFSSRGSGEWMVYGGSLNRTSRVTGSDSLTNTEGEENLPTAPSLATSPPEKGRFGSRGSGEWRVYGRSTGCTSSPASSDSLPNRENEDGLSAATQLATSPPAARGGGRFGSGGSGEWRVYGGRLSRAGTDGQVISPPSSYTSSGPRLSSAGSGGRLSSSCVVRRSSSVGSGGKLSSSGSGGRLSSSPGGNRISSSGRLASTGSGEWKQVYSSASGCRSSVGSAGGGMTSSQRAPSPGGRMSISGGSGGRLNSSTAGGNRISSAGSGSKLSGSNDRISSQAGGRISTSSGSGRTSSTGGRVISSSDRPVRSSGSGTGGNKERISVCKMAALSMSAAGRERSQDGRRQAQRSQQQQQQQAAATSPLVQRWLTTGVGVTSADPDGLEDVMRL